MVNKKVIKNKNVNKMMSSVPVGIGTNCVLVA
jgi:hypothetical protein